MVDVGGGGEWEGERAGQEAMQFGRETEHEGKDPKTIAEEECRESSS